MAHQTRGLNPFLPFDTYIPDGEPKVFGDRVYLYGSCDRFGGGYCCDRYRVFSAPLADLTDWTDHGVSFSVEAVPWSDADLYAPDALEKDGKYYLFFCLSDGTEGVAESDSPAGPFGNARQITLNGAPVTGIDPSVLADHGRVYYTWGQFRLRMGELNDDMCTLKPETVREGVITNEDGAEGFHEGSSLRKIGDTYCLIYASEYTDAWPHHGGRPTKLDYAVSVSPYGPYTRRGTVIDNDGCDPATWNNHGSVIRIGGRWYVFYHASSNDSEASRRARAERLTVDETGCVITQAAPTTKGFAERLTPEMLTSPVHACRFFGGAYVTQTPEGRFPAVGLKSGAGFAFSETAFAAGAYALTLEGRFFAQTGLRVLLGGAEALRATVAPGTAQTALRFSAPAAEVPVTLAFDGPPDTSLCEIDALRFSPCE